MSDKVKNPPEQKPKLSKKAQKAAKQEEKNRQNQKKPEKKQFSKLTGIATKNKAEFDGEQFIQVRNKTVQEYAQEAVSRWEKGSISIVGFGRGIPKAISVAEIFKRKIGVYDQREFKVDQNTQILKDENGGPIIEIKMLKH